MTYLFGIVILLIVFCWIIFIHELWHFMMAKLFGVKVNEFGIGIPPRLFKIYEDKSWTEYSINALPIWWFVSLKGEQYDEISIYTHDSFAGSNFFKKSIIILAWVAFNFLLSGIIISYLFYVWVQPFSINTQFEWVYKTKLIPTLKDSINEWMIKHKWLILSPVKWSIAEKSWMKDKDILLEINWKKVEEPQEMINAVKYFTPPIEFTVSRENKIQRFSVTPENWKIWAYVGYNLLKMNDKYIIKYDIQEALVNWFKEVYSEIRMSADILGILIKNIVTPSTSRERTEALNSFWGIVSIWWVFTDMAKSNVDIKAYLTIAAMLSVSIWFFNLLPIPALDWWRFFLILLNWIVIILFWKKMINEKTETLIFTFGYIILILLTILVTFSDIMKLMHK